MSKCTCRNRMVIAQDACEEALSVVDKTLSVVMRNYLSSVSLGEGGADLWSLLACIAFQLKLLKVPAHTQWVEQALHNLCPAVWPHKWGQLSFFKMLFLKQPNSPTPPPSPEEGTALPCQSLAPSCLAVDVFCCHSVLININHAVQVSHSERMERADERW